MSLQKLVEPQCGEGNPVLKITHHFTKDAAHTQDISFVKTKFTAEQHTNESSLINADGLVNEFLHTTGSIQHSVPFQMDELFNEMQKIELRNIMPEENTWSAEFLANKDATQLHNIPQSENWNNEFLLSSGQNVDLSEFENHWHDTQHIGGPTSSFDSSVADTEKANTQIQETAQGLLGAIQNTKFEKTEFANYVQSFVPNSIETDNTTTTKTAKDWSKEFLAEKQDNWTEWEPSHPSWIEEFAKDKQFNVDSESLNTSDKEFVWKTLQEEWQKESAGEEHSWMQEWDNMDPFVTYKFQSENPLKEHPDPLSEGKRCLMEEDLPSAVLLFEAAAQRNPSCSEAWRLLGTTHAQNEQDGHAIAALKKCTELDPSDLIAWMALATSYTNESYQNFACQSLKEWIKNNPEYTNLVSSKEYPTLLTSSFAPRELVDEVQQMYLRAANQRPMSDLDGDVQCGLGVLFNLTGDYDKAVDCFMAALQVKSNDAKLWNKLGATLANSSKSAESIDAYRRALEISPGFIRCRYNLGIACINLGAYREAIDHFLDALNMQAKGKGLSHEATQIAVSDNIWNTMRICVQKLDANHLIDVVVRRDLRTLNMEFKFEEKQSMRPS